MVEGNSGDVVVQNVGFNDAVEEVATNEAELAVNGGCGAASKGPGLGIVVRKGRVGVLKECDGD